MNHIVSYLRISSNYQFFRVLVGIEPYSLLSQSNTLTEYATNTVVLGGVEPPRTPSKGVGLPLADKTI